MAVVDVRRVRVALDVGEGVVLAVVGDPGDHRALDRRRAERGERRADPLLRLERAVGEVAVEAERDAEPGQHVADHEHDHVAPVQEALPGEHAGGADRDEGQDGHGPGDDAVARLVRDGLDVVALHALRSCCVLPPRVMYSGTLTQSDVEDAFQGKYPPDDRK